MHKGQSAGRDGRGAASESAEGAFESCGGHAGHGAGDAGELPVGHLPAAADRLTDKNLQSQRTAGFLIYPVNKSVIHN